MFCTIVGTVKFKDQLVTNGTPRIRIAIADKQRTGNENNLSLVIPVGKQLSGQSFFKFQFGIISPLLWFNFCRNG